MLPQNARSGISEGKSATGAGQAESSRDPTCDTGRMRLSPPRAAAASVGILPSRHLNLSLGFAVGADDIGTCCVHDWLWLLKLQPPPKEADIYQNSHHLYKSVQASWFNAPVIQKSLVTGSISRAKFLEDDPRSSRQIGPPEDTRFGAQAYFIFSCSEIKKLMFI